MLLKWASGDFGESSDNLAQHRFFGGTVSYFSYIKGENKKVLSYETFRLYLGQNGYTVTATAQAESNDFTNVTKWRKQQAEQEARAYEEREEPKLFAQEADKYQMMNARILYEFV